MLHFQLLRFPSFYLVTPRLTLLLLFRNYVKIIFFSMTKPKNAFMDIGV